MDEIAAERCAPGRDEALPIENGSDLFVHFVFGIQLADTSFELGEPGILLIGLPVFQIILIKT